MAALADAVAVPAARDGLVMSETPLKPEHERRLGSRLIAMFIDAGFLIQWPFAWTDKGTKARKETFNA